MSEQLTRPRGVFWPVFGAIMAAVAVLVAVVLVIKVVQDKRHDDYCDRLSEEAVDRTGEGSFDDAIKRLNTAAECYEK